MIAPLHYFQIGEHDVPVKKRTSKTNAKQNVIVKSSDYELKKDGGGIFLNDEIAVTFGRHALITHGDLKEVLTGYI